MRAKGTSGIYCITNTINNKIYIGASKNIENRWHSHKNDLRKNKHRNKKLQNSWNKHTGSAFEFKIVLICDEKDLDLYEQSFLDFFKLWDDTIGYNIQPYVRSNRGVKMSDEAKKKMSIARLGKSPANKGVPLSEELKENLRVKNRGKSPIAETREKIRIASTGRWHTEEAKRKISEKNSGKKLSEEQKQNLREINTGKKLSEEAKEHLRVINTGKKMSPEAIAKSVGTRKVNMLKKEREIWWAGQSIMFEAQSLLQNTNFNI